MSRIEELLYQTLFNQRILNVRPLWPYYRHLYKPMLSSGYSKTQAMLAVFLLSALFHEVSEVDWQVLVEIVYWLENINVHGTIFHYPDTCTRT